MFAAFHGRHSLLLLHIKSILCVGESTVGEWKRKRIEIGNYSVKIISHEISPSKMTSKKADLKNTKKRSNKADHSSMIFLFRNHSNYVCHERFPCYQDMRQRLVPNSSVARDASRVHFTATKMPKNFVAGLFSLRNAELILAITFTLLSITVRVK